MQTFCQHNMHWAVSFSVIFHQQGAAVDTQLPHMQYKHVLK